MPAVPDNAPFVCLYSGPADECRSCGGWTKAGGGPFPGDSRFCSEDCYADDQDRQAKIAAREQWCPECGYDQGEHGPDCKAVKAGVKP
jgi:hypothetical protein